MVFKTVFFNSELPFENALKHFIWWLKVVL